jgi:hypothetical protein
MIEPQYSLSSNTFACATSFHWILLDLNSDKYLAIHRRDFEPLALALQGVVPRLPAGSEHALESSSATVALASELIDRNLLVHDSRNGKRLTPVDIAASRRALRPAAAGDRIAPHLRYMPSFLAASVKADYRLRRHPIAQVVRSVALRKRRRGRGVNCGPGAADKLVDAFNVLRPLYPRDYLCLFDSLALIEFLAHYGLLPTWVFGVTSDPFLAHCWVQDGDTVMNDTVEHVGPFVPLMTV